MRILLIDVDSKIPNLALMKISAYHKKLGDIVGFHIEDPDKIYVSTVFPENKGQVRGITSFYPDVPIEIGGTGYDLELTLPDEIESIKPDYDLYPDMDYSLGFTTRGCIRKCKFCFVPEKEGKFRRTQHPSEFHDQRFKKIQLLDNNWLADKEWFMQTSQWILENNLSIIENGMDIRIIDNDLIERLSKLKFDKPMKFAWDNMHDEPKVREGIELLYKHGVDLRREVSFYVLVGFNTTHEQDYYRCVKLKELGTAPFVMIYNKKKDPFLRALARWCNRKWSFFAGDLEDYFNNYRPNPKLKAYLLTIKENIKELYR